jgi:heparan-alpha-glucosaminide N-acetyltransferase
MLFKYSSKVFISQISQFFRGYTGPGGLHEEMRYQNCTGGLVGYVDRLILGEQHLYPTPTCSILYQTGSFDPVGLYSKFNALKYWPIL